MKPLILSLILAPILIVTAGLIANTKIAVKYSQIFAEKKITLTEHMTVAEKSNLKNKKGFIRYE